MMQTINVGHDIYLQNPSRLRPMNMYGYSKQLFDLWALRHGLLGKIAD